MKITKKYLQQIIREELKNTLSEAAILAEDWPGWAKEMPGRPPRPGGRDKPTTPKVELSVDVMKAFKIEPMMMDMAWNSCCWPENRMALRQKGEAAALAAMMKDAFERYKSIENLPTRTIQANTEFRLNKFGRRWSGVVGDPAPNWIIILHTTWNRGESTERYETPELPADLNKDNRLKVGKSGAETAEPSAWQKDTWRRGWLLGLEPALFSDALKRKRLKTPKP